MAQLRAFFFIPDPESQTFIAIQAIIEVATLELCVSFSFLLQIYAFSNLCCIWPIVFAQSDYRHLLRRHHFPLHLLLSLPFFYVNEAANPTSPSIALALVDVGFADERESPEK